MKKSFLLIVMLLALLPISVFAESSHSLAMLDLLGENRELKVTSWSSLPANFLDGSGGKTPKEDIAYDIEYSNVISAYIDDLDVIKKYRKEHSDESIDTHVFCKSYTKCGIRFVDENYEYDNTADSENNYPSPYFTEFTISMDVNQTPNMEVYDYIKSKFGVTNSGVSWKTYYMFDMSFLNQFLNKNAGDANLLEKMGSTKDVEMFFPEIKDIYESYPGLTLRYVADSVAGSVASSVMHSRTASYISLYNNVAYADQVLEFSLAPIILVDKNSTDVIDAAKKRIEDYINDSSVKVSIKDVTEEYKKANEKELVEAIPKDIEDYLKDATGEEVKDNNLVYELSIDGKKINIFIAKVSADAIVKQEITSFERATGIRMKTYSSDVPLDTRLIVENVLNSLKSDESILEAYDITLYSLYKNGYVSVVKGDVKVMIPVADDFDPTGKKVYHIDENGNKTDEYEMSVEVVDGQKYVTFITNHFSTYAIVNTSNKQENVPPVEENPPVEETPPKKEDGKKNPETGAFISIVSLAAILAVGGTITYFAKNKHKFTRI